MRKIYLVNIKAVIHSIRHKVNIIYRKRHKRLQELNNHLQEIYSVAGIKQLFKTTGTVQRLMNIGRKLQVSEYLLKTNEAFHLPRDTSSQIFNYIHITLRCET